MAAFIIKVVHHEEENIFVEADSLEEAQAKVMAGEGEDSEVESEGWKILTTTPVSNLCAYCGKGEAKDDNALWRDGYQKGPEVFLCDECFYKGPTNEEIWKKLAWKKLAQD